MKFPEERKLMTSRSGEPGATGKQPWVLYKLMGLKGQYLSEHNRAQKRDVTAIPDFNEDFKENECEENYVYAQSSLNNNELEIVEIGSQGVFSPLSDSELTNQGSSLLIPFLRGALAKASTKIGRNIVITNKPNKNQNSFPKYKVKECSDDKAFNP
ncbi:hypothetical protein QYM36_001765 [Artemia franciscana]|uniref:Uncharacterized protein n=1 Tax=Artemia franciscana TaxID=6661 RepID=A0AA88I860_ARTSF|nr:hypothetical protein QYM36_001765 [Artemia franciscana]